MKYLQSDNSKNTYGLYGEVIGPGHLVAIIEFEPAADGEKLIRSIAAGPALLTLTDELLQVCDWFQSAVNSLRLGETIDTHPDWNAVEYLESQAQGIRFRAAAAIAEARGSDTPPRGTQRRAESQQG